MVDGERDQAEARSKDRRTLQRLARSTPTSPCTWTTGGPIASMRRPSGTTGSTWTGSRRPTPAPASPRRRSRPRWWTRSISGPSSGGWSTPRDGSKRTPPVRRRQGGRPRPLAVPAARCAGPGGHGPGAGPRRLRGAGRHGARGRPAPREHLAAGLRPGCISGSGRGRPPCCGAPSGPTRTTSGSTIDLARSLMGAGQPDEAVRFYSAAVAIRPRSELALVALGEALRAAGRTDEAAAYPRPRWRLPGPGRRGPSPRNGAAD